jgi:hypothetical protein
MSPGSSRDVTEGSLSRRTRNALDLRMIVPVLAGCAAGGPGRSSACACPRWRSFLSWPGRWCGRGGSRPLARMPRGPRCWYPSPSSAQWPWGAAVLDVTIPLTGSADLRPTWPRRAIAIARAGVAVVAVAASGDGSACPIRNTGQTSGGSFCSARRKGPPPHLSLPMARDGQQSDLTAPRPQSTPVDVQARGRRTEQPGSARLIW